MRTDPYDYNITIRRTEIEGETCFEARVKELPDLTEYGDTFEEAYALAVDAIETTMEVLVEKGRAMPAPYKPADDYSGRVTLRLSKSLHRALAETAEEEGVSLNQHLVNILSYYSGFAAGALGEAAQWKPIKGPTPPRRASKPQLRVIDSRRPADLRAAEGWA